jgi:hypothetical protein
MAQISKRVRSLIQGRLASVWLTKLAASRHGYTCPESDKQALSDIDWSGARSKQVFYGDVDPEDIAETLTAKRPICTIWTEGADEDGEEKFRLFSGTVAAYVRINWEGAIVENFQEVLDLAEDGFVECFKDRNWLGGLQVTTMARGVGITRGAITKGGSNWRQSITVRLTIGVDL